MLAFQEVALDGAVNPGTGCTIEGLIPFKADENRYLWTFTLPD